MHAVPCFSRWHCSVLCVVSFRAPGPPSFFSNIDSLVVSRAGDGSRLKRDRRHHGLDSRDLLTKKFLCRSGDRFATTTTHRTGMRSSAEVT